MIRSQGPALVLGCDVDGCPDTFRPKRPAIDVTCTPEQRAELEMQLRLTASRNGWSSARIGEKPWRDVCPAHGNDPRKRAA